MWSLLQEFYKIFRQKTIDPAMEWVNLQRRNQKYAAFSVALICLCAKLAKADGVVSQTETEQFKRIFQYPEKEEKNVISLYNLAAEDVHGYEFYAKRIAKLFANEPAIKEDVFESLVLIAIADDNISETEVKFLANVALIFELSVMVLDRIYSLSGILPDDDWLIMGLSKKSAKSEVRSKYLALAKKYHPDALAGRGVPHHAMLLAEKRMSRINEAYNNIISK